VQKAWIILADEPIASLDPESSRRIMEILQKLNRENGLTIVVSLHQVDYAKKYCQRAVALNSGRICYDGPSEKLSPQLMHEIYGGDLEGFVEENVMPFAPPFPTAPVYSAEMEPSWAQNA
jgi:phosphonate transport system ATP-binding protein